MLPRVPGFFSRFGTAATKNTGTAAGNVVALDSSARLPAVNASQLTGLPQRNILLNPAFQINLELLSSNADDTYGHDGWYVLTQSNAIAVSTLSDVEDEMTAMARLTQSNASAQRIGYAQIVEGKYCKHLRGRSVTFRIGRYRCSSAQAIRFAVLEWTGTEDSVTSDVVNDWTSSTYTAGNFFLASNLTVSGVTSETPSAATLTNGPSLTVTLGSTFNNLVVFVWTEGTAEQNVTLDLGKAKVEDGAYATSFVWPDYGQELLRCQRCYCKTFPFETAPAQNAGTTGAIQVTASGTSANLAVWTIWQFPVEMRIAPAITTYNPSAAATSWRGISGGNLTASTGNITTNKTDLIASAIATDGEHYSIHATASARL